jgi:hypothetical protein
LSRLYLATLLAARCLCWFFGRTEGIHIFEFYHIFHSIRARFAFDFPLQKLWSSYLWAFADCTRLRDPNLSVFVGFLALQSLIVMGLAGERRFMTNSNPSRLKMGQTRN